MFIEKIAIVHLTRLHPETEPAIMPSEIVAFILIKWLLDSDIMDFGHVHVFDYSERTLVKAPTGEEVSRVA